MLFCGERQTPRGSKVERARIACNLSDYESEITAAQPLFQREQGIFRRFSSDMNKPVTHPLWQTSAIGPA